MRVIEKMGRAFWEDVAQNCSYASFFHTPYWSDIMAKTFAYTDVTKGFIFDDGTRVVFPFMWIKKKHLKGLFYLSDYVSGPLYVYGGPISDGQLNKYKLDEIFEYLNSTFNPYNIILIRGNPFGQLIAPSGFKKVEDSSHVVELYKYKSEEDLLRSYSKHNQRYLKKLTRSNMLRFKEAMHIDEYEKLYKLYKKSFGYWDEVLTDYPQILFQNLFDLKNDYMKLWVAYYKNIMIGGMVLLFWNQYCTGFMSYHDRKSPKLNSNRFVLHNCFLYCIEKGFRYFDFRQSGGIKGLEHYKKSMLGVEYPHIAWLKENSFIKNMRCLKQFLKCANTKNG